MTDLICELCDKPIEDSAYCFLGPGVIEAHNRCVDTARDEAVINRICSADFLVTDDMLPGIEAARRDFAATVAKLKEAHHG